MEFSKEFIQKLSEIFFEEENFEEDFSIPKRPDRY
jgi:hypothetical protein